MVRGFSDRDWHAADGFNRVEQIYHFRQRAIISFKIKNVEVYYSEKYNVNKETHYWCPIR